MLSGNYLLRLSRELSFAPSIALAEQRLHNARRIVPMLAAVGTPIDSFLEFFRRNDRLKLTI
jgi:hypothetical protein